MRLSKPQMLIYSMEHYTKGAVSVLCGSFFFDGNEDIIKISGALNNVIKNNDMLRARMIDINNPCQVIIDYSQQDFQLLSFNQESEFESYAEQYATIPLDFYGALLDVKIIALPNKNGVLFKLHHIIGDAWSMALLGRQFLSAMEGNEYKYGKYEEYITREDRYLCSNRYIRDQEFFLNQFHLCETPTFLKEIETNDKRSKRKTVIIDTEHVRRIKEYCNSNMISPFVLFEAAFSLYFSIVHQNIESFYIGIAVINRDTVEDMNTVGMYVNTVPLLVTLNYMDSVIENIQKIKGSILSTMRHQGCNYGDSLAYIRSNTDFAGKLYDVLISYQNGQVDNRYKTNWYHCGIQEESLQIHFDDRDDKGVLRISYDYQISKFNDSEIERMHEHITNIISAMIEDSSQPLSGINMLSENERHRIITVFNNTKVMYENKQCVHTLFEDQVKKRPNNTAVIASDQVLTYDELNKQANRIANYLINSGVKVGDIVGFILPRRSYVLSTMLGILKSGAAYLPIDPEYPQDRIELMLSDSGAKMHITENTINKMLQFNKDDEPHIEEDSNTICYCIYTSGSTGIPKGTLLTHHNVVNFSSNNKYNLISEVINSSCKRILSVTTVGFDIFVTESLLPLLNGMEIVLANEEQSRFQPALNALLKEYPCDVMQTTPTKMRMLSADENEIAYIKNLKAIILGGEPIDYSLVENLKEITQARIYNIYGPTETTVWSSYVEVQ